MKTVLLEHGSGGLLTDQLISEVFLPHLKNDALARMDDSARVNVDGCRLCFSTDAYVVQPCFFPGGDIGSIAVYGTVNDLAMGGARPLYLSSALIIEEGFPIDSLRAVTASMAKAARTAGVQIVAGDTKVVQKGAGDGIYITTAGIGLCTTSSPLGPDCIRPGDAIVLSGPIGDHGAAIMACREQITLPEAIRSDSAPLSAMVADVLAACSSVHCMRDATRGGLGAILCELARQSGLRFTIREAHIPVREPVRGLTEILGLDPLFLANEGTMALLCPAADAPAVVAAMQRSPCGAGAVVIGAVTPDERGRVIMETAIGGRRELDLPAGELVPRIC